MPSELSSKLAYQLRDKLLRTNQEDSDNFVLSFCTKWKHSNKTSVSVEDLTCLVKTTLLPPILTKFKHLKIDTSKITANLTSHDVSDFSTNDFINLFTSTKCIRLFKQAFSRMQKPTLLKLLLTKRCNEDITLKNETGDGLAGIFAGSGMVEGLKYVIEHSQSLAYQRNNMGETPFYLAAQNGHKNCVEALLTLEEDAGMQHFHFNEATNNGQTPLDVAAINGHESVIEAMKKIKGINFNQVNTRYKLISPLSLAVHYGHTAVVKTMLQQDNIFTNTKTEPNSILLFAASTLETTDIFEALLTKLDKSDRVFNPSISYGWSILNQIAESNSINHNMLNVLLKHMKIKPNGMTSYNSSMLPWLAEHNFPCIMKVFIEHGANPNEKGFRDFTALHIAARSGKIELVEYLLNHESIDVNVTSEWGDTPLTMAVKYGEKEVVKRLLQREDINVQQITNDDKIALHFAIEIDDLSIIKALLHKGGIKQPEQCRASLYQLISESPIQMKTDLIKLGVYPSKWYRFKKELRKLSCY